MSPAAPAQSPEPGKRGALARRLHLWLTPWRLAALQLLATARQFVCALRELAKPLWRDARARRLAILCGLTHMVLEWAHTAFDVRLSFLQRSYMTSLQARERHSFQRGLLKWIVGSTLSRWIDLGKDTFRMNVALLWHRALFHEMLTVCFDKQGLLRVHSGFPVENADQSVVVASRELVSQVMQTLVLLNSSISNVAQYAPVLWRIRPLLLPALALNGCAGLCVSLRGFAAWLYRVTNAEIAEAAGIRRSFIRAELRAEDIALCAAEQAERRFLDAQIDDWFDARWANLLVMRAREAWNSLYAETLHTIPLVLVSSAYLSKSVDFGAISQAMQAFRTVHASSTGIVSGRLLLWTNMTRNALHVQSVLEAGESAPPLGCRAAAVDAAAAGPPVSCPDDEPVLECQDLEVRVHAPHLASDCPPLLRDLSLRLFPKEALLIVGPSGSGKTSLLRTLVGVWPSKKGRLRCNVGAGQVTFMPQKPLMAPSGSFLQQLLYPLPEAASEAACHDALATDGQRLLQAALDAGLGTVLTRLRGGGAVDSSMDPAVLAALGAGSWVELLSPGEQQRLAFARTFVQRPALVLMDEATSALDLALEAELYGRLRRTGCSIVSIAHRPSLLRFHTHVLEISPGAAGAAGTWRLCTAEEFSRSRRWEL